MRALAWISPALFALAASVLGASTALAQFMPCSGPTSCGMDVCVSEFGGPGFCVPFACVAAEPTALAGVCFAGADPDPMARFAAGDCDGDLIANGAEPDAASLCDGGLVALFDPATGAARWLPGQRLTGAGVDGGAIAPHDAVSNQRGAIGIGCSATRPCPNLPSDSLGLSPRCVFLGIDDGEERGVCTYYVEPRPDRTCLELSAAGDVLPARCVDPDFTQPHERWEHGDCDGDGLINKLDNLVCHGILVVGIITMGQAGCAAGHVENGDGLCGGRAMDVTPTRSACTTDLGGVAPFGVCCVTSAHCPIEDVEPPFDTPGPRCVRISTFRGDGGVCTYGASTMPDDDSCLAVSGLPTSCLSEFSDLPSHANWVGGDCDACEALNPDDALVCGCAPLADAGGADAAVNAEEDAGGTSPADTGATSEDASAADLDAAPLPPVSFGGSGCRCSAPGGALEAGSRGALAFLAALLFGAAPLGRRRER